MMRYLSGNTLELGIGGFRTLEKNSVGHCCIAIFAANDEESLELSTRQGN